MMLIIFRKRAENGLRELLSYLEIAAPGSVQPVTDDLSRSLETISTFPSSGAQVSGKEYRRIITPRYHFKIVYVVKDEQITILGILRQQARET